MDYPGKKHETTWSEFDLMERHLMSPSDLMERHLLVLALTLET
jgi:hypothetical protein